MRYELVFLIEEMLYKCTVSLLLKQKKIHDWRN